MKFAMFVWFYSVKIVTYMHLFWPSEAKQNQVLLKSRFNNMQRNLWLSSKLAIWNIKGKRGRFIYIFFRYGVIDKVSD